MIVAGNLGAAADVAAPFSAAAAMLRGSDDGYAGGAAKPAAGGVSDLMDLTLPPATAKVSLVLRVLPSRMLISLS